MIYEYPSGNGSTISHQTESCQNQQLKRCRFCWENMLGQFSRGYFENDPTRTNLKSYGPFAKSLEVSRFHKWFPPAGEARFKGSNLGRLNLNHPWRFPTKTQASHANQRPRAWDTTANLAAQRIHQRGWITGVGQNGKFSTNFSGWKKNVWNHHQNVDFCW